MDKFSHPKIVLATHNQGKWKEFADLFAPLGIEILGAHQLGLPEPIENGDSFTENALIKARAAAKATQLPALADDSGLCVRALDGAPGIHSARWAETGGGRDFNTAMARLHKALAPHVDKHAAFVAILALVIPSSPQNQQQEHVFEGRVDGEISWPPRGDMGFGYDPIFQPAGQDKSFAEMSATEKASFSHRTRAFAKLRKALF